MADPPRFEHGFEAPQAPVISRLHYGSSEPVDRRLLFNFAGLKNYFFTGSEAKRFSNLAVLISLILDRHKDLQSCV